MYVYVYIYIYYYKYIYIYIYYIHTNISYIVVFKGESAAVFIRVLCKSIVLLAGHANKPLGLI